MDGILIINKEMAYTSRDVVNIVGKILKTKQIGHTGTLDPLATGVLVLCVGKATKLVELLTNTEKEYIAEITLGLKTDTLDITGNILENKAVMKTKEEILVALNKQKGHQLQEVPLYSAVKIKGKKLYEYARSNIEVELPQKEVMIKEIELLDDIKQAADKTIFTIRCVVSKGTYIRSLVTDIATSLDTIGVMSALKRTKQGRFTINDAYNIEDLKCNDFKFIAIEEVLKDYYQVVVKEPLLTKIKNGALLDNIYSQDIIYFVDEDNKALAIYKKYDKDVKKIKPWKMF